MLPGLDEVPAPPDAKSTLRPVVLAAREVPIRVVEADEKESGVRATLNLGHTFGHAIETGLGYGEWLHGEAIAVGMVMAADLSRRLGWITEADVARVETLIKRAGLPTCPPASLDASRMLELMSVDKKVRDGKMHLVLLESIGKAVVTDDFSPDLLHETLNLGRKAG